MPAVNNDQKSLMRESGNSSVVLPGSTIGMMGGGQLGRMFAIAAAELGYRVAVFCEDENSPAAQVSQTVCVGDMHDQGAVTRFTEQCDVITLEFENIPAESIATCMSVTPTYPAASVLATAQDRVDEKTTFRDSGLPVTPFVEVSDAEGLLAASEELGWPMIVKTARSGYDGKGQHRVESPSEAATVNWSLADRWIAEQCINFSREISVIVARTADGRHATFPVFENVHRNHILDITVAPAAIDSVLADRAAAIATDAAERLGVVGLLCVEMFVIDSGGHSDVMINEVAPRPHNSGHLTIESCHTSQFEQHVRAVCGLPLGDTGMISGAGAMVNLLGDLWLQHDGLPPWDRTLEVEGVRLHLYGKAIAKAGRKMGHVTAAAHTTEEAKRRVLAARAAIES